MSPTPGLSWSDRNADPLGDVQAFIQLMRSDPNAAFTQLSCTCPACRSGTPGYDNLGYSIYSRVQQAPEEWLSDDAARWTPSLAEEEEILTQAKTLLPPDDAYR